MPKKRRLKSPTPTSTLPVRLTKDDRDTRDTVIMFVDIVGASEVSNHKTPKEYSEFVEEFQHIFKSTCRQFVDEWYPNECEYVQYDARGDEGLLMIYPPSAEGDLSTDVDIAINIALALKGIWICSNGNSSRIDSDLLPIDLAIGIHTGKTRLRSGPESKTNCGGWILEGYAINLAKRVESHSRAGKYTGILISEAAHGHLNYLSDEKVYVSDEPQRVPAKGISREIRGFEIMHHFLPTDWTFSDPISRSKWLLKERKEEEVETLLKAKKINPTNTWLAEEFIRSSMFINYNKLRESERGDPQALKKAFSDAKETANYLAQGDQRDPGILMIQGLIDSECYDFPKERERYAQARKFSKQVAVLDWYEGYSYSHEIWAAVGEDEDMTYATLKPTSPNIS